MSNTVPLADALPWDAPPGGGRTIVVCDSVKSDGRFILHALATRVLSALPQATAGSARRGGGRGGGGGRVLWIACGPATERHVASALKKMGGDASFSLAHNRSASGSRFRVLSVALGLAEWAGREGDAAGADDGGGDSDAYLKTLYTQINSWSKDSTPIVEEEGKVDLIVVDDMSLLSVLFGARPAFFFFHMVRQIIRRVGGCLVVRCSHDSQQNHPLNRNESEGVVGTQGTRWVGVGGNLAAEENVSAALYPNWEDNLIEQADGIVDVTPLPSGYSREAHGRLVFTERKGGMGWRDRRGDAGVSKTGLSLSTVVNFCCVDNGVRAILLRSESHVAS